MLTPDSVRIISDGSELRRNLIDWGLFHVEPEYQSVHVNYRRVLQQRNAALREHESGTLDAWTSELADLGNRLGGLRVGHINQMIPIWNHYVQKFLGIRAEIKFERGWPDGRTLEETLAADASKDRSQGFTRSGPHRADLKLRVDNDLARYALSRGEAKLFVCAFTLAQAAYINSRPQTPKPLVLLDDLPSEFDDRSLSRVMSELDALEIQAFLTTNSSGRLAPWETDTTKVFHVERGAINK